MKFFKQTYFSVIPLLIVLLSILSCGEDESDVMEHLQSRQISNANLKIDAVFFAQTHVQKPDSEYFTLVSDRKALVKVHVISGSSQQSSDVKAIVKLNGEKLEIPLAGPKYLPSFVGKEPCDVTHSYDDSFTGFIPKEWVKPGMTVKIKAGKQKVKYNNLTISAPTVLKINMFDIYTFNDGEKDFPEGWKEEFEAKLPIKELQVERQKAVFEEVVVIPNGERPAKRIFLKNEARKGEQTAARWMGALMDASGLARRTNLYYLNTHNLSVSGGRGADFHGVGQVGQEGYLVHEGGHALSLAHCNQGHYPYKKGQICGIDVEKEHVGTTWFFDLNHEKFISPISELKGTFRKTPMLGGGRGQEKEDWAKTNMKFFSDYEVNKMKNYLEKHVAVWNEELQGYASWNAQTNDYTIPIENDGVQYPVERDAKVLSVLISVSAVTEEANIIYPPIGPYTAGLINLFDPRNVTDRVKAQAYFCPPEGCDVSLMIIQGGKKKYVMLPISWDETADPLEKQSFKTRAVNLPARDGNITKVKLLFTPDAEKNGLPTNADVIIKWKK